VRPSTEFHVGFSLSQRQRKKYSLENQAHRASAAPIGGLGHVEGVFSRTDGTARNQDHRLRAELIPFEFGVAHGSRSPDGGQVLGPQPRLTPSRADILDARGSFGEHGQR
jgi:hypothetical protein